MNTGSSIKLCYSRNIFMGVKVGLKNNNLQDIVKITRRHSHLQKQCSIKKSLLVTGKYQKSWFGFLL